jgi:hypothetical protein
MENANGNKVRRPRFKVFSYPGCHVPIPYCKGATATRLQRRRQSREVSVKMRLEFVPIAS